MSKKIKTIGMVVAMEKEVIPFLTRIGKSVKSEKRGSFEVFTCRVGNKKICLVKSGIGEIYASSATQLLISEYKVDLVMNFGVCGSLIKSLEVMQTVIVNGVVHYDFDLSLIDDVKVGQYPNYISPIIETDKDLIKLTKSVIPNAKEVICASADKFVAENSVKKRLNENFGAVVCDMECAGVLLTANGYNIPTVIIKAVSDGEGGAEEFQKTVKLASEAYISAVLEIVKEL